MMDRDYVIENKKGYDTIYQNGWGNRYPDSYLISVYYNIIRPLLERGRQLRCLDFGCSLGANTKFFQDVGFDVYGIDISQYAIEECINRNGFDKGKFVAADILENGMRIHELFPDIKFDLVTASNVLYYFADESILDILKQFKDCMRVGGCIYANMHTMKSYYFNGVKEDRNGMYKLIQSGSIDSVTYMNGVKGREDMLEMFKMFKKAGMLLTYMEGFEEMGVEDYHFIGVNDLEESGKKGL